MPQKLFDDPLFEMQAYALEVQDPTPTWKRPRWMDPAAPAGTWGNAGIGNAEGVITFHCSEAPPEPITRTLTDTIDTTRPNDLTPQNAANVLYRLRKYGQRESEFTRLLEKHANGCPPGPNGYGKAVEAKP